MGPKKIERISTRLLIRNNFNDLLLMSFNFNWMEHIKITLRKYLCISIDAIRSFISSHSSAHLNIYKCINLQAANAMYGILRMLIMQIIMKKNLPIWRKDGEIKKNIWHALRGRTFVEWILRSQITSTLQYLHVTWFVWHYLWN